MSDQDEFLTGGTLGAFTKATLGGRVSQIGDRVRLLVTEEPRQQQQRDYTSGELKSYKDGKPAMQLVVVGQLDGQFEPVDDHDDGRRAVYIKGGTKDDVMAGLRAAGTRRIDVGGVLDITIDREIPNPDPRKDAAKRWKVVYEKPTTDQGLDPLASERAVDRFQGATSNSATQPEAAATATVSPDDFLRLVDAFGADQAKALRTQPDKARALLATL